MLPKHLALLQAMFPGVVMLDIDQIALLMKYGRGHLYNLHHEGKLPFKVSRGIGNKILVSVIEMAAYLDKAMLSEYEPEPQAPELVVKKKRGRPRGSTTKLGAEVYAFQNELRSAMQRVHEEALPSAEESIAGSWLDLDGQSGQAQVIPFEARQIPFFLSPDGLIAALVVDCDGANLSAFQSLQVRWMTWPQALSFVWSNETKRLGWLEKMATVMSNLHEVVGGRRRMTLLGL